MRLESFKAQSGVTAVLPAHLPQRWDRLVEMSVLLLFVVPGMVLAYFATAHAETGFVLAATAIMVHDIALVSLIRFLIWRVGEPAAEIGWRFAHRWPDVALGFLLFVPLTFAADWLHDTLRELGLPGATGPRPSFLPDSGGPDLLLAAMMVAVVAVSEETVFRGYLMSRLRAIGLSALSAVLVSSLIFAMGHGYEGAAGMLTVGAMGATYALIYLWRGSLVAPVVMHFLQDTAAIVLLPLLR
jgi:membrane protease YdiL (CAAX protease family)